MMLANLLETEELAILTEPIVLEYLDVLARPAVRGLTGLTGRQSEDLVTSLISLSRQVQTITSHGRSRIGGGTTWTACRTIHSSGRARRRFCGMRRRGR
jgi:hypothetical protein